MTLPNNTLLQGGKYRIVRFISSGGFGCTYEAEHVMLGKRVAIKEFFVKDFCNRDETTSHVIVGTQSKVALVSKLKKKFIEEASALSRFNHPNIVHVSDVFEENGTAYYVMDFINGKSIHEILKMQPTIPETKAVKYITQIAEALKQVHAQNILHLDIKPGNIMIDQNDNAILIDFGVSKQYDEANGENTSTLIGKAPGYSPIEQMGNSVQSFTPATDIYSLGATLYKMLTGTTPPEANILVADDGVIKPISSNISKSIREAVSKAMQVKRKDRPQSVSDFLNLLGNGSTSSLANCDDSLKKEPNVGKENDESTIIDDSRCHVNESPAEKKPSTESTETQHHTEPLIQTTSLKKMRIVVVLVALFVIGACVITFITRKSSVDITLSSPSDSISYSTGVITAEGLRRYVSSEFDIDTIYGLNDFMKGYMAAINDIENNSDSRLDSLSIEDKINSSEASIKAYGVGYSIGIQVSDMCSALKDLRHDFTCNRRALAMGFIHKVMGDELELPYDMCKNIFDKTFLLETNQDQTSTDRRELANNETTNNNLDSEDRNISTDIPSIDWSKVMKDDRLFLDNDIDRAIAFLKSLPSDAAYLEERPEVLSLLQSSHQKISANELSKYKKVRSIQVGNLGIFSYDYFNCKFSKKNNGIYFQKTTGSQRKSGYIFREDNNKCIFLGGWTVNDDPLTTYGSENSVAGSLYKIGPNKLLMVFADDYGFELYEFIK